MGRGRYEAGEVWRLVGSELEEDWNYWIVQFRVAPLANWIVGWIVPWWGRYEAKWPLARLNPPHDELIVDWNVPLQ